MVKGTVIWKNNTVETVTARDWPALFAELGKGEIKAFSGKTITTAGIRQGKDGRKNENV